jgi:UDP-N-acetyl-alpha-D-muramoyl-L-alanyl-L-glutamate epimerase
MNTYRQFIFEDYHFDTETQVLRLNYSLDGILRFQETYHFDVEATGYDQEILDRALQNLFFMAGVSYYKTYVPSEIVIKAGSLDASGAAFFSKTYQRGLGEFWYVNKLDPRTAVDFPVTSSESVPHLQAAVEGTLIGVGGGKDSLVSIEMLRAELPGASTWSLGHRLQLSPLVERIGLPHSWVDRQWDRSLLELNGQGALNGHVPISAIFACVGTVLAILTGRRDVVVSNEQAANEPTLEYQGVQINHQYSKSQEFERDYQDYLEHCFGGSQRYYSFLRPFSELYIAELFAKVAFDKYADVFSSCNRAFTHSSDHMFWCGECPKCAFVFLILTPFIARDRLESLWSGKNLLLDPELEPTYRQLLGIEGDKPLECVGEIKESRAAMRLAQEQYPELVGRFEFELPDDYDYRALMSDELPPEIRSIIDSSLKAV